MKSAIALGAVAAHLASLARWGRNSAASLVGSPPPSIVPEAAAAKLTVEPAAAAAAAANGPPPLLVARKPIGVDVLLGFGEVPRLQSKG
mmetsp:Transcript_72724/g.146368  ORF Transcript_72724/g.146368 Transcript_72724/m.146368 type:complete len:89 (-) Transcript_72724:60-326(-)